MFNVFVPFHPKLVAALREVNRRWLVSQKNIHAEEEAIGEAIPILLTDYDEIITAKTHWQAIDPRDRYRFILDLENEVHRKKVEELIMPGSGYRVYAAFIDDLEKVKRQLNEKYSASIRQYISKKTSWKIGRDESIYPNLELVFGELYVILKYASQIHRLRLSELEKY